MKNILALLNIEFLLKEDSMKTFIKNSKFLELLNLNKLPTKTTLFFSFSNFFEEYSLSFYPQMRFPISVILIFVFILHFILILDRGRFWRFFRDDPIF